MYYERELLDENNKLKQEIERLRYIISIQEEEIEYLRMDIEFLKTNIDILNDQINYWISK